MLVKSCIILKGSESETHSCYKMNKPKHLNFDREKKKTFHIPNGFNYLTNNMFLAKSCCALHFAKLLSFSNWYVLHQSSIEILASSHLD